MELFQDVMDAVLSLTQEMNCSPYDGIQSALVLQLPAPLAFSPPGSPMCPHSPRRTVTGTG